MTGTLRYQPGDHVWFTGPSATGEICEPATVTEVDGDRILIQPEALPGIDLRVPVEEVFAECSAEIFGATRIDQAAMCEREATWTDQFGDHWCDQHEPMPDDQYGTIPE